VRDILLDAVSRGLRAALIERDDICGRDQQSSHRASSTRAPLPRAVPDRSRPRSPSRTGPIAEARASPGSVSSHFCSPCTAGPWARPFFGPGSPCTTCSAPPRWRIFHRHLSVEDSLAAVPGLRRKGPAWRIFSTTTARRTTQGTPSASSGPLARRGPGGHARESPAWYRGGRSHRRMQPSAMSSPVPSLTSAPASIIDATGVWTDVPMAIPGGERPVDEAESWHSHRRPAGSDSRVQFRVDTSDTASSLLLVPLAGSVGHRDDGHEDHGSPDRPAPTLAEVDEILENVNGTLDVGLTRRDVVAAFAGIRPLATDPAGRRARLSRRPASTGFARSQTASSGSAAASSRLIA